MKLIVGLGNPGRKYEKTRHNAGFMVASALADKHGIRLSSKSFDSLIGKGRISGDEVIIALPQVYMNRSGQSVRAVSARRKLELSDILVICDDVNLRLGIVRIRSNGSAGGHNGLTSVIEHLGSGNFARLRIGVGKEVESEYLSSYVLSPFTKGEEKILGDVIGASVECCEAWIRDGVECAANVFNTKNRKEGR